MSSETDGRDRVLDAINEAMRVAGKSGIVHGYVVMAAYTDEDGDERLYHDAFEDQRASVTLGLLHYAVIVEEEEVRRSWREQEGDE